MRRRRCMLRIVSVVSCMALAGGCPQQLIQDATAPESNTAADTMTATPVADANLAALAEYLRSLPDVILPDPPPAEFYDGTPPDVAGGLRPADLRIGGSGAGDAGDAGGSINTLDDADGPDTPDDNSTDGDGDTTDGDDDTTDGDGAADPPPSGPLAAGEYSAVVAGRYRQFVDAILGDPNELRELDLELPVGGIWHDADFDVAVTLDADGLLTRAFVPGFIESPDQLTLLPSVGESVDLDGSFSLSASGPWIESTLTVTVIELRIVDEHSVLRAHLHLVGASETFVVDMVAEHETRLTLDGGAPDYLSTTEYDGVIANPIAEVGAEVREKYVQAGLLKP